MGYMEWIAIADEYYLAARSLQWFSGLGFPNTYAGHHAIELYLKSVTIRVRGDYLNCHDLKLLYQEAVSVDPSIEHEAIPFAIVKYYNYDQGARYGVEVSSKQQPTFPGMGTDSLRALDFAVASLRDLTAETGKGLDRLVAGETYLTKLGMDDPHLALNSVILFHFNDAFTPLKPEIMEGVNFSAPLWKVNDPF